MELNLFSLSPDFLIEDEYIFYYINIVCGMCCMLLWCVVSKFFYSGGCDILLACCDVFKQSRRSHKLWMSMSHVSQTCPGYVWSILQLIMNISHMSQTFLKDKIIYFIIIKWFVTCVIFWIYYGSLSGACDMLCTFKQNRRSKNSMH